MLVSRLIRQLNRSNSASYRGTMTMFQSPALFTPPAVGSKFKTKNMTSKRLIQILISISAILIAIVYLVFPDIRIDAILITLIIIAIIPWLAPLFKSVELPGGLKVEFQELQKIEIEAKKAGLIKENVGIEDSSTYNQNPEIYSFIEIAERNQELALVAFRIEIEKRLRSLADKYSIEKNKYSISKLIDSLALNEILSQDEKTALKDIIHTLNNAAHGIVYDQRNVKWVIENGSKILESLDEKLELRGGRYSVGRSYEKTHWIDKSFHNCDWTTNSEWADCIQKHTELWEKELNKIFDSLSKKLNEPQKTKLIESQRNWDKQLELEKDLIYSFSDIHIRIGRGGLLITASNFMNKIRERTLELEEILNNMTD